MAQAAELFQAQVPACLKRRRKRVRSQKAPQGGNLCHGVKGAETKVSHEGTRSRNCQVSVWFSCSRLSSSGTRATHGARAHGFVKEPSCICDV